VGAVAAPDDVHVTRAAGDDEAGLGALALDQRVDGDGGAVDQLIDGGGVEPALADTVDDALHQLGRGGEAFGLDEAPAAVVEPDEVGEGAPDIDGNGDQADTRTRCLRRTIKLCFTGGPTCLGGLAALRRPWAGARKPAIVREKARTSRRFAMRSGLAAFAPIGLVSAPALAQAPAGPAAYPTKPVTIVV